MSGENGPATNLRKTPGRMASKMANNNCDEHDSEVEQVASDLGKSFKKPKTRRPTGKRVLPVNSTSASQNLMQAFLKKKVTGEETTLTVYSIEGYDTEPESLQHNVGTNLSRRNSENDLSKLKEIGDFSLDTNFIRKNSVLSIDDNYMSAKSSPASSQDIADVSVSARKTMEPSIDDQHNQQYTETVELTYGASCVNATGGANSMNTTCDDAYQSQSDNRTKINGDDCLVSDCNFELGQILEQNKQGIKRTQGNRETIDGAGYKSAYTTSYTIPTTRVVTTTSSMIMTASTASTYSTPWHLDQQRTAMQWQRYYQENSANNWTSSNAAAVIDTAKNSDPVVLGMLNSISAQISGIAMQMSSMKTDIQSMEAKLDGVNFDMQEQQNTLDETVERCNNCFDQVDLLTTVSVRQENEIGKLKDRLNRIEADSMKSHLLISGIEEKEEEDCSKLITNFFKLKCKITDTIEIKDAHRIGQGTNRTIRVKLADDDDKGKIFNNAKNLRGKKNNRDKGYFIQNEQPEALQEEE